MLSSLAPHALWQIFAEICAIPHPSHHEEKITEYILDFAKKHKLWAEQDKAGNILIRKKASPGMEKCPSIALQAHLDMVPQKNEGTHHDFLVDPIQPYIEEGWVKAKETTLGADNGIGLASALAVLADNAIKHGPLEVLVTVSEEIGMVGAFGLQPDWLQSKYLINTDSEDEGEIFIGCAGGVEFTQSIPVTRTSAPKQHDMALRLCIKGLKGGHSGCDINAGRGNAIKLLARFLAEYADELGFRMADFQGGSLRNAIPREAFTILTLNHSDYNLFKERVDTYQEILRQEYHYTEPDLIFTEHLIVPDVILDVISNKHQKILIDWLNAAPNGVVRMNDKPANIVETSLNLGIVKIEDNQIIARYLVRSLLDSAKNSVISSLISFSKLAEINYTLSGEYPGWTPNEHSPLLALAKEKYKSLFSTHATVMVIHAGLECGLFKTPYPDVDMISIGPTIVSPHSPDEKVNIVSVQRYWELLLVLLKSACELH